jgi:hypothetical protein
MQDEGLRTQCATAASKLSAEAFVWENEARKYVATYERVLTPETLRDAAKAGSPLT